MLSIPLDSLEIYGFVDPAAGKEARTRRRLARQVIVIGSRDWYDRWFFPYIWAGRETASDFADKIIEAYETHSPRRFGIEANGMQVLFGSLVREKAKESEERVGKIKMIPIYQPTNVDKNFRIRNGLEPVINQGRLFLQSGEIAARAELQGFPTAATKDIVDSLETLISRVAPKRPIRNVKSHEESDYATYLRASGMPAHLIEQEMLKFGSNSVTVERRTYN